MVSQKLLDYIQKELDKGFSDKQIQKMLLKYNYSKEMVIEAFSLLQNNVQNNNIQNNNMQKNNMQKNNWSKKQEIKEIDQKVVLTDKLKSTSYNYVLLLSALVTVMLLFQLIISYTVLNLIMSLVFLFVAVMTVVFVKQNNNNNNNQKFALQYKMFLIFNIIIFISLIIKLFRAK